MPEADNVILAHNAINKNEETLTHEGPVRVADLPSTHRSHRWPRDGAQAGLTRVTLHIDE